jgi:4-(gamma-glutamylamino)butanal dehydrogenase
MESTAGVGEGIWRERAVRLDWRTGILLDGVLRPASGETSTGPLRIVSPRDGSQVADFAGASSADVDRAVRSARAAFEDRRWAGLSPTRRGDILIRFADLVAEAAEELALRISVEMGKPVLDALTVELRATVDCLRWYGQLADKLVDEAPVTADDALGLVTREPAGVVGAVVPWNFPLTMAAWKLGPALAAGNSVVLKPAEQTSLSALRLGELALEAGVPPGVLNVVPGHGPVAGAALGLHTDVDVITFTGSVEVGRRFLGYSAESNGKRVWPELGGKTASVILPDADVALAASTTAWGCFYNQGQMCSATSRMIVHRDVAGEAIEHALARAAVMQPADPLGPDAPLGATVSAQHLEQVSGHVQRALAHGATALCGAQPSAVTPRGSYFTPTVLVDVEPTQAIAREEVFGPVLAVFVVDDSDEAVHLANDTPYGLAAALWTRDVSTVHRLSRRLRAGTVWVNSFEEGNIAMPFGGSKASGFGRDKGAHAIDKYTDTKTTWLQLENR